MSQQHLIVTSFRHEHPTGTRFLETFRAWNMRDYSLAVYVDHARGEHEGRDLEELRDWRTWHEAETDERARRFGHKVFAITDAAAGLPSGWLVWMDADIEFTGPIDLSFLREDSAFCYLGRPWFRWSECGFVGYNLGFQETHAVLSGMRNTYMAHEPITQRWGHDSATFDRERERHSQEHLWQDLTGHLDPSTVEQNGLHVWPKSPLASFSTHHKGPQRKETAYHES